LQVPINQEIQEYEEHIFFGLSLRQLFFSGLAIGASLSIYFGLRNVLGTETVSWLCIVGALPFGAMGFLKYNGMSAEQFAMAWIRSELLLPKKLRFESENALYAALKESINNQYAPVTPKKKKRKKGEKSHAQKPKQHTEKR